MKDTERPLNGTRGSSARRMSVNLRGQETIGRGMENLDGGWRLIERARRSGGKPRPFSYDDVEED
jgi:hypothetical protein